VDDGSTDGTAEAVRQFCLSLSLNSVSTSSFASLTETCRWSNDEARDFQILYAKQDNGGPSSARNAGIQISGSEVVAFLDVDDFWQKDKLAQQISLLESGPCDFVFTNTILKDKNGNESLMYPSTEPLPFEMRNNILTDPWLSLLETNYVTTSSVLAKKACFGEGRLFNVKRRLAEDWELWLKLSDKFSFGYVSDACVIKEQVENSLSSDNTGMLVSSIEVLENHLMSKFALKNATHVTDPYAKEVLFTAYKWAGYSALLARERLLSRKYLFNALKVKLDLQTISYYFRSFFLF
ncbi:glycosyltransferase family 2 protein, partial [Deltaproteobacteria bacterium]|nr:glycosyltransferase family 2 protein [Deltaproteobacteria bacterium]